MIIHFVRTSKLPFIESKAHPLLTIGTIITIVGTIITPILLHNISSFHFELLSFKYYLCVLGLLVLYSIIVEIVKRLYVNKNGKWL